MSTTLPRDCSGQPVVVEGNCKFCGTPVKLVCDPLGLTYWKDPENLLKLAACNRCADFRVARSRLLDAARACSARVSISAESEKVRGQMLRVEQLFRELVNCFYRVDLPGASNWVDGVMRRPQQFPDLLMAMELSAKREKKGQAPTLFSRPTAPDP